MEVYLDLLYFYNHETSFSSCIQRAFIFHQFHFSIYSITIGVIAVLYISERYVCSGINKTWRRRSRKQRLVGKATQTLCRNNSRKSSWHFQKQRYRESFPLADKSMPTKVTALLSSPKLSWLCLRVKYEALCEMTMEILVKTTSLFLSVTKTAIYLRTCVHAL